MPFYSGKRAQEPDFPGNVYLFINGDFQLHSGNEEVYHEYFAHVPIAAARTVPERVLILGAGDGILAHELLKYPGVKSITMVELDPVILDLARSHPQLQRMNRDSLADPRMRVMTGDAYRFVRDTDKLFDAIYIDFPSPKNFDLAKLYSVEFYAMVHNRLAPGGFAVADVPGLNLFLQPTAGGRQKIDPDNLWFDLAPALHAGGFGSVQPFVSRFENDNPDALAFLRTKQIDFPERDQLSPAEIPIVEAAYRRRYLKRFAFEMQQGFVLLAREPGRFSENAPFDPGVPLYVLNEKRFRRAFSMPFPQARGPENSIIRPTLPDLPVWHMRFPY
jgi:spermidine synthase